MLSVTPIGSCRIATPLRSGRATFNLRYNHDRVYGYSHSSSEAVQQVLFLHEEFKPLPELWPLIASDKSYEGKAAERHIASDIYVVEISSAKAMSIAGQYVQLNYLRRHFSDFFSDPVRTQTLTRLSRSGDSTALAEYLDATWANTPEKQEDSGILRHLRMETCDEAMLVEHLGLLRDVLPHVLFVSHVNARGRDGQRLPARDRLIQDLEAAVQKVGVKFDNPTALMEAYGQSEAIEDNSTSLAHFTGAFSSKLLGHWYDAWLLEMIEELVLENPQANIRRIIAPLARAVATQDNRDRQAELADLLESIASFWPDNLPLRAALIDLSLVAENDTQAYREFRHLAVNCDVTRADDLSTFANWMPQVRSWIAELLTDKGLSPTKQADLSSLARSLAPIT